MRENLNQSWTHKVGRAEAGSSDRELNKYDSSFLTSLAQAQRSGTRGDKGTRERNFERPSLYSDSSHPVSSNTSLAHSARSYVKHRSCNVKDDKLSLLDSKHSELKTLTCDHAAPTPPHSDTSHAERAAMRARATLPMLNELPPRSLNWRSSNSLSLGASSIHNP
eukprot:3928260-Pyramimonas_sp.AAC.1